MKKYLKNFCFCKGNQEKHDFITHALSNQIVITSSNIENVLDFCEILHITNNNTNINNIFESNNNIIIIESNNISFESNNKTKYSNYITNKHSNISEPIKKINYFQDL